VRTAQRQVFQQGLVRTFHSSRPNLAGMNAKRKDFYEILGVPRDISKADLKKAYFQLAQKHHPDKNPNDAKAAENFADISNAYEVLSDDAKRQQYDHFGEVSDQPGHGGMASPADAEDLFERLFGRASRPRHGTFCCNFVVIHNRVSGPSIQLQMQLHFMEAVKGVSKTINIPSTDSCSTCSGSGVKPNTSPIVCTA